MLVDPTQSDDRVEHRARALTENASTYWLHSLSNNNVHKYARGCHVNHRLPYPLSTHTHTRSYLIST